MLQLALSFLLSIGEHEYVFPCSVRAVVRPATYDQPVTKIDRRSKVLQVVVVLMKQIAAITFDVKFMNLVTIVVNSHDECPDVLALRSMLLAITD